MLNAKRLTARPRFKKDRRIIHHSLCLGFPDFKIFLAVNLTPRTEGRKAISVFLAHFFPQSLQKDPTKKKSFKNLALSEFQKDQRI